MMEKPLSAYRLFEPESGRYPTNDKMLLPSRV